MGNQRSAEGNSVRGQGQPASRKAVLLMREDPEGRENPEGMRELRGLAEAAGYRVIGELAQRRGRASHYQVGKGKIQEALALQPDRLIFYDSLSPAQFYSIRKEFDVQIMDRFNLILEIFASRASTREAKLQVELARLTYEAPLVKKMIALKKLSERPGFHGGGSYEESMFQDFRGRMAKIRAALKDVEVMGMDRRRHRRELGFDLVALAGYTNAGKSTLQNLLTGSGVAVEDQLFTTLSPTTRAVEIKDRKLLLTDPGGFIDDLPHFMIKAFRSTLSEISCADLILLVVDLSDPPEELCRKLAACHRALWDCESSAPIIAVLNKVDRLTEEEVAERLVAIEDLAPEPVAVSARVGTGAGELIGRILETLEPLAEARITLPNTPQGQRELSRICQELELVFVLHGQEVQATVRGRKETLSRVLAGLQGQQDGAEGIDHERVHIDVCPGQTAGEREEESL
ncbi:MAG: GTPase HflX [Methanosarcinales archaeon]|nr:GTPase HflX [Methanosarcinales archaeon]